MNRIADHASIVLVGSFNPMIFHPIWFEKQGLLPAGETDNSKIEVVSSDVAIFTVPWLRVEVLRERFVIRTSDESKFGPLRDLALGALRLLEHTPVSQLGMNRDLAFSLESAEEWHAVGHKLAPKAVWAPHLNVPGMVSLTMRGERKDGRDGSVNVTVKSENNPANTVSLACNDHFQLAANSTALQAVHIIENGWDQSMETSSVLSHDLIKACLS